jgi:hypothetical protein
VRGGARAALLLALLGQLGCAPSQALVAGVGRQTLVGLAEDDLRLCAGVPDREARTPTAAFWTYERTPPAGSVSFALPAWGGAVSLGGGGECRVTFQIEHGRVARIGTSGASELGLARDAACAPVVQGCLRLLRQGRLRIAGGGPGDDAEY